MSHSHQNPENSITKKWQPAKIIAFCALALWIASLPLTVFSLSNGDEWRGISVLLTGWLGLLLLNAAWLANIFFLYAFIKIQRGKPVFWSVIIAIILSFDSFLLSSILLDEGGGSSLIDSYGWGFVLWFLSLFVLAVAAGTEDEYDVEYKFGAIKFYGMKFLRPLGIFLVSATICFSLFFAAYDRFRGNSEEKNLLSGMAFKRGSVCTIMPPPSFTQPVINESGAVEVRNLLVSSYSSGGRGFLRRPFDEVADLLAWGIPVVRVNDRDFSFVKLGDEWILTSYPAKSPAAAMISIDYRGIALLDGGAEHILFEQKWDMQEIEQRERFCPQFSTHPREDEQPRKFIVEALGVHKNEEIAQQRYSHDKMEKIEMETLSDEPLGSSYAPFKYPEKSRYRNKSCANGLESAEPPGALVEVGYRYSTSFRTGSKVFYIHGNPQYSICTASHVYLVNTRILNQESGFETRVDIKKRALPSFRRVWSGEASIEGRFSLEDVDVNDASGQSILTLIFTDEAKDGKKVFKEVKLGVQDAPVSNNASDETQDEAPGE